MSTRMLARRRAHVQVAQGVDRALWGVALPRESRINDIKGKLQCVVQAPSGLSLVHYYGVEAWILPVLDPDSEPSIDVLWDTLVPKDTDADDMDLDTTAVDTTPFFEPGEVDWSQVIDVGLRPERVYARYGFMSFLDALVRRQDNQTPFSMEFYGGTRMDVRIRKNYVVMQPSMLVLGVANPAGDDTTAVVPASPPEQNWGQIQYIDHVLERAMMQLFGLIETGAETPWVEAAAMLQRHLEPDIFESVAGYVASEQHVWHANFMIDMSVQGSMKKPVITTGR